MKLYLNLIHSLKNLNGKNLSVSGNRSMKMKEGNSWVVVESINSYSPTEHLMVTPKYSQIHQLHSTRHTLLSSCILSTIPAHAFFHIFPTLSHCFSSPLSLQIKGQRNSFFSVPVLDVLDLTDKLGSLLRLWFFIFGLF